MLYELRLYSVTQGRMADVHSRFTDHLPALFTRHGVNCVGAWTALAGPNAPRFVYLMAYRDYAHREAVWASFYTDPEWMRVRTETNAGHEMVERHDLFFLKPNAAWQVASTPAAESVGGLHELVLQQIAPGQNAAANEFMTTTYLPLLRESGARTLGVFDMASGSGMQQVVMLHAWADALAWRNGRLAIEAASSLRQAFTAQRQKLGQPFFGRCEVNLLEPVPGVAVHPTLGRVA
jgi:hypothetical protein